jgi:hypothetical protein
MKYLLQMGAISCLMLIGGVGCGGGPGADTASVTGKVTVAGQPVENITVTLQSEGGGRPAIGITDSSGNFSLATFSKGDGAVPGKHKVSFGMSGTDSAALPFNKKYLNPATSGIIADVVAGQSNELPVWDLEK